MMRYSGKIHNPTMFVKAALGTLQKMTGDLNYPSNELIVVNYHSTPKKFMRDFEAQVDFFKKLFEIINPNQLNDYFSGNYKSKRCSLLFTFDDGLKNNLYAAEVLAKHQIQAFFFVIPKFIDTQADSQKNYYLNNIRPVINPAVDTEPEDFTALSWEEIVLLRQGGNAIGSHTHSHTLIAANSSQHNSELEIKESKLEIEKKIGTTITTFCSINNTLESVGSKEKKLIEQNYNFHFTTLPGLNAENKNALFIKRRNIECYWLRGAVYFAIGKSDLKRWSGKIKHYENLK